MEPPKIIREVDSHEGRGCWMGCFGIGCLVMVVGFFGLLVGGWYAAMHTGLPLILIEQGLEQDGKIKIEGLSGSISDGVTIEQLKFLTNDKEHWSELRGVKFDYNGFVAMMRTGRFVVERMSVDSGTIYAEIEGPDDFFFSAGDLDSMDEFKDSDLSEMRVDLLEVKDLKIVNLDTDYSIEIENASLKNFVARGDDGIVNFGDLTIKSNMLEAVTEPSNKWPGSTAAKRVRGQLRAKFSERLKQDIDFVFDFDFQKDATRQSVSLFQNAWTQEFSKRERSIQLVDFSPGDYFTADQILASHIQLSATHQSDEESSKSNAKETVDGDRPKVAWQIAPGASFQLGNTTFQIQSVEGNRAPLRSIIGTAMVKGESVSAELRCRGYLQKGRIELKVGEQPADQKDWAQVVYNTDFDSLQRDQQRLVEATLTASKREDAESKTKDRPDDEPKAEAEDPSEPADTSPPPIQNIPEPVPPSPPSDPKDNG